MLTGFLISNPFEFANIVSHFAEESSAQIFKNKPTREPIEMKLCVILQNIFVVFCDHSEHFAS